MNWVCTSCGLNSDTGHYATLLYVGLQVMEAGSSRAVRTQGLVSPTGDCLDTPHTPAIGSGRAHADLPGFESNSGDRIVNPGQKTSSRGDKLESELKTTTTNDGNDVDDESDDDESQMESQNHDQNLARSPNYPTT